MGLSEVSHASNVKVYFFLYTILFVLLYESVNLVSFRTLCFPSFS